MVKKYYLINLLLILIIAFLVNENYRVRTSPPPAGKETVGSKPKTLVPVSSSPAAKKEKPDPAVFRSVSDKNIFSPNRKEFPIPLTPDPTKKPPVRPNVQLFGVAIDEGFHSAVITNPTRRADKGERETMTVKEGEKVGEYSVAKILPDRITLESSVDSFDVLLYDPTKPMKRPVIAPTKTPTPPTPAPPRRVSTTPPRPYTPPAVTNPPVRQPAGTITRPQVPQTRIPAPPARRLPAPETDDDDDDDDDDD